MSGKLEGKVALVTGAGSVGPGWGNGRAAAVLFAQEGAKVFAVDHNATAMDETVERIAEHRGTVAVHECDVTDSAAVRAMIETCREKFGRVDVLLNNVGGSAAGGAAEMSEEVWDAQIDVNLKSVFLGCKHVIPVRAAQGGGVIVNTASTSGIRWTGSAQVA
ncbi:MAG: SDR family NAD(P)-dependent oxidoreductase, partial [Alphaproteobacteria bacterium]|nr:SDR family NAD(P)-dependent oxidoreductase [Alphaproteobacteria bacterium]